MAIKENEMMNKTVAELREKVAAYEKDQELRKKDRKTVDSMQRYQEQVNGLLSAKSGNFSSHSWI